MISLIFIHRVLEWQQFTVYGRGKERILTLRPMSLNFGIQISILSVLMNMCLFYLRQSLAFSPKISRKNSADSQTQTWSFSLLSKNIYVYFFKCATIFSCRGVMKCMTLLMSKYTNLLVYYHLSCLAQSSVAAHEYSCYYNVFTTTTQTMFTLV